MRAPRRTQTKNFSVAVKILKNGVRNLILHKSRILTVHRKIKIQTEENSKFKFKI